MYKEGVAELPKTAFKLEGMLQGITVRSTVYNVHFD